MKLSARGLATAVAAIAILLSVGAASQAELLVKEGDRVVFLGDSITQQRIYTRYVMDYFALRYPELGVTFRNAGVGGDTAVGAIKRLDKDVLDLRPDVVTVCFGMNDAGYGPFNEERYETYMAAMTVLLAELKGEGAKVVLLSPGPVDPDRGESWLDWNVYNDVLRRYAEGVKELAGRKAAVFADSRTLMLDVQTRAKQDDPKFTMIPDAIHPSAPGQALMAYALLKALGCDRQPSGLIVDAAAEKVAADRCEVEGLSVSEREVRFTRRDLALPTYFDPEVSAVFARAPMLTEMNRYPFAVSGLAPGKWRLTVAGAEVGTFSAEELGQGVDLAALPGPWQQLARAVNDLVKDQESIYLQKRELNGMFSWIATPPPEAEVEKLALMKKLDEAVGARERAWAGLVNDRTWEWRLARVE
ncbi:MAG: SGNH/GDSL hydrolase family protein [Armatimonadota bacterium]